MTTSPEETLLIPAQRLEELPLCTAPLLDWYGRNARRLPWRESADPYRVWVSEIMLQQTRVEAVLGYYARFMEELPTVDHLAGVEPDRLLKLWEGLGYYSRARNLQKSACLVMEEHGGCLPADYEQLRALPGIGEYTAGAIASIAFGIPVPAVDGNVYRVLSRLLGSFADTSAPAVKRAFRQAALLWLPEDRPGDFNQAIMDLGATVCLPNGAPRCLECPLSRQCAAHLEGCAAELPVKAPKKPRRVEQRTLLFILADNRLLLFKRKQKLLAGMYEPLNLEEAIPEPRMTALLDFMDCAPESITPLGEATHVFTHIEWRMQGYLVRCTPFAAGNGQWLSRREAAVPSAFRRFLRQIPDWE